MGQQQLLLIVLSVIIVGVAVAVGVTQFQSSAVDANRQQLIGDLVNHASKAQRYYRTPQQLGGGAQDFNGFNLGTLEQSNANGTYNATATEPTGTTQVATGGTGITATAQTIYIEGSGTEIGDDGTAQVKAYVTVTPTTITTTILN